MAHDGSLQAFDKVVHDVTTWLGEMRQGGHSMEARAKLEHELRRQFRHCVDMCLREQEQIWTKRDADTNDSAEKRLQSVLQKKQLQMQMQAREQMQMQAREQGKRAKKALCGKVADALALQEKVKGRGTLMLHSMFLLWSCAVRREHRKAREVFDSTTAGSKTKACKEGQENAVPLNGITQVLPDRCRQVSKPLSEVLDNRPAAQSPVTNLKRAGEHALQREASGTLQSYDPKVVVNLNAWSYEPPALREDHGLRTPPPARYEVPPSSAAVLPQSLLSDRRPPAMVSPNINPPAAAVKGQMVSAPLNRPSSRGGCLSPPMSPAPPPPRLGLPGYAATTVAGQSFLHSGRTSPGHPGPTSPWQMTRSGTAGPLVHHAQPARHNTPSYVVQGALSPYASNASRATSYVPLATHHPQMCYRRA